MVDGGFLRHTAFCQVDAIVRRAIIKNNKRQFRIEFVYPDQAITQRKTLMYKKFNKQAQKQPGMIVICTYEGEPVILDNGKIYTSLTNNLEDRSADLKSYFEHYRTHKNHAVYEADADKLKAIELHGGQLMCVPFKAYSHSHAKTQVNELNMPLRKVA